MPMVTPENSWFGETSRYGRSRNLNLNHSQNQREPISETDRIPSILNSKSTISSLLFPTAENPTTQNKKKNFSSASFRGLGCTASSQVSVPAVIRTSADWETKKVKKKKQNSKKNQGLLNAPPTAVAMGGITASSSSSSATTSVPSTNNGSINSLSLSLTSSCVAVPDVWCGPGMGLTTDAASVDCVVSRRPLSGRGKVDGEKMSHRERPSYSARRMVTQEDIPFLDSDASFSVPRSRIDSFGSRHHRHTRHGFPEGLAEIVMLQNNLMMGGRYDGHDRYRDWRLDVDHMSYEELLELGERIGYVNTGLKEDEISKSVRKAKVSVADDLRLRIHTELERKCSICQEEYEADDEMGKLNCDHLFHLECIKQWLAQKNACPMCKTEVVKNR
ncbi:OLC1v1014119C2 [Oldenlandia corymbosa var. corymbosa]|uniref:RING-type E3 ubiquitin transferase n=1 Tax=Oldenlandia corymbosa var. corymbosa TaxID=529605 RepID=A0AAV1E233_OLDCO|nr:OLC1v1014119C2 [Oldenlandia corymbosa var. corymbosa]